MIQSIRKNKNSIEDIFFCDTEKGIVNYNKLIIDSLEYDPIYESNVRNKNINLLYILDEIMLNVLDLDTGIIRALSEIEDIVVSSMYEENEIPKVVRNDAVIKVKTLCWNVNKNVNLILRKVSQDQYTTSIEEFRSLDLPRDKKEFVAEIKNLLSSINNYII